MNNKSKQNKSFKKVLTRNLTNLFRFRELLNTFSRQNDARVKGKDKKINFIFFIFILFFMLYYSFFVYFYLFIYANVKTYKITQTNKQKNRKNCYTYQKYSRNRTRFRALLSTESFYSSLFNYIYHNN